MCIRDRLSNDVKDPVVALELYRTRDVVEKAFWNIKERLNLRRTLVSSESSLEGKLFVEFIALIYLSYIKKKMEEKKMFGTVSYTHLDVYKRQGSVGAIFSNCSCVNCIMRTIAFLLVLFKGKGK